MVNEVLDGIPRLPGEQELLTHMVSHWPYGGTLGQISATFDPLRRREVSAEQLIEVLLAYGDITEVGGLYYPHKRDRTFSKPSTD